MSGNKINEATWRGLRAEARSELESRDYGAGTIKERIASSGVDASALMECRSELDDVWIPGVEIFKRRVFHQKGRGYFSELTRTSEGVLSEIGLEPRQWASALMHRDSAKGFHIHPPFVPAGEDPEEWFCGLYGEGIDDYSRRPYDKEQWDVMFFLQGICDMLLVDERAGMPRRIMRINIYGDNRPGDNNAGVVIPAGVAHALRSIGHEEVIMVYGTRTVFEPEWEGRLEAGIEESRIPEAWRSYLFSD